ncbi:MULTISPECIES: LysR family transcriptional regulator [Rhizobium]|uniref:LysR family transcriptional regulator n=1 Tax=Rhizobium rhododendri TaxID=2506430 RepID=A0ABY8ILN5_9HYPH|nr:MULTISPECIES: LysR family transcriptional regulator [Rhizobium]MBZ5758481.1 LysR family transcriptional regulator [Rhizobium sp. VS19-DR96]MBZ5764689.1 LysR family transcriptional regulator [Rhizobium sp. VS19-DR129.2]MBZ5772232.1 LysR family transcriptional regulator [Rhizobium sp. VS19-DRK62.2]MBZ5783081.1 LysR family transcriptional regulator [Rhizobium sp. VS19-DR121]MBZ5800529.1 LysR family transcriptional regulator [Rhizobium sp. VS19-DR181]
MSKTDVNRSGEMEIFVRVVDLGGFSAAARASRLTPSAISKLMTRLEGRLGTRLLNRSTRTLQLTTEGSLFYDSSVRILADIAEAERNASVGELAIGRIRINTSASFANHVLAPLVPQFLRLYPAVTLEITVTDAVVDLMAENADVAIRAGPMKSSQLVARKLGGTSMAIVATPDYLEEHGTPRTPADLDRHRKIAFSYRRAVAGWPLLVDGKCVAKKLVSTIEASDGEAMRHLCLAGGGLARLASFTIRDDVAAGRLLVVLDDCNPDDIEAFHAVYIGEGGPVPARVRALLDFLAEHVRLS